MKPDNTGKVEYPLFLDRYQILSLLGKGGFSEVYKVFDLHTFEYKAFKLHRLSESWDDGLKRNYIKHATREFRVQESIIHENIVRHFETVEISDNEFGTVLEYCEGPDLSTYLKKNKNISEKEAKTIIKQVLNALKCLSQHKDGKIIHYDLKPGNILFSNGFIKVADFGLCKQIENDKNVIDLTSFGTGTYWYLPPETFDVQPGRSTSISPKVDIWSVGVIFFELLYGIKPFGQGMMQSDILKQRVMLRATNVDFPETRKVSSDIKEFIKRCLSYHQEDRFDIDEAYDALCK